MGRQVFIEAFQGDDETYTFNVKDSSGTAVDLTGATSFTGTVRDKIGGSSLATFSYNSGASTLASGVVAMDLANADTLTLPEIAYYDVQYTNVGGQKKTLAYGVITTKPQVTTA